MERQTLLSFGVNVREPSWLTLGSNPPLAAPASGSIDLEEWTPAVTVTVGSNGPFPLEYGVTVGAGTFNEPNQDVARAAVSADGFLSGMQVLDLADNLLWEFSPNADGSPGDRFALILYDPESNEPLKALSMGAPRPEITIGVAESGNREVRSTGILQQSADLVEWTDMEPQPGPTFELPSGRLRQFYRARTP